MDISETTRSLLPSCGIASYQPIEGETYSTEISCWKPNPLPYFYRAIITGKVVKLFDCWLLVGILSALIVRLERLRIIRVAS